MIKGYRSLAGTIDYFKKFNESMVLKNDRYWFSRVGLGTFIGDFSDEHSIKFRGTIKHALLNGVNLIDTAINYRGMRSERDIGIVLKGLVESGQVQRNQFVISSKAGIIPGDGEIMLRPINYMQENLIDTGLLTEDDVYMVDTLWLTMNPNYFNYAVDVSRKHLNLETIDIYYMHELELSMKHYGPEVFYHKLKDVISTYESMVSEGKICEYGMATWDAFQIDEEESQYISLERVMSIAESVSTNHHFKHLMLPLNLGKTEAITRESQDYLSDKLSIVECARKFDLQVHISGPLGQGENLDNTPICDYIEYLSENCRREAIIIGTKSITHFDTNIDLVFESTKKW